VLALALVASDGLLAVFGSPGTCDLCELPAQPVSAAPVITTAWNNLDGAKLMVTTLPDALATAQAVDRTKAMNPHRRAARDPL
jgi:hypothetical protein